MAASDVRAGRAYVEVAVKDNLSVGLTRALTRLRAFAAAVSRVGRAMTSIGDFMGRFGHRLASVGRGFIGLGLVIGGALFLAAKSVKDFAKEIIKGAERTGITVDSLQGLAFAARATAVDFKELETAIRRMDGAIARLAKGNVNAQHAFRALHLTLNDLKDLSPDEQLKLIATRLSQVENKTLKAALAIEIFGRGGTLILPMLERGGAGIEEFARQAKALGIVMGEEDVRASGKFFIILEQVWEQIKAVARQIGVAIAEAVGPYVDSIQRAIKRTIDWIRNNRGLAVSIVKISAGTAAASIAIGIAMVVIGKAFQIAGVAITGVGIALRVLGFLASPLGLLVIAITAAAAAFLYFTGIGGRVLALLKGGFSEAIKAMADALKSGNVKLAGEILFAELELVWLKGTRRLREIWADLTGNSLKPIADKIAAAQAKMDALKKKAGDAARATREATAGGQHPSKGADDDDRGLEDLAKTASRLQFGGVNAELALGGAGGPLEQTADNTAMTNELLGDLPEKIFDKAARLFNYWAKGTKAGEAEKTPGGIAADSLLGQLRDEAARNPNNRATADRLARAEREVAESRRLIIGEGSQVPTLRETKNAKDQTAVNDAIEARNAQVAIDRAKRFREIDASTNNPRSREMQKSAYDTAVLPREMQRAANFVRETMENYQKAGAQQDRAFKKREMEDREKAGPLAMPKETMLRFMYQAGIGGDLLEGAATVGTPKPATDKSETKLQEISDATKKSATALTELVRRTPFGGLAFT